MNTPESGSLWTRRRALKLGAVAGGLLAANPFATRLALADDDDKDRDDDNTLPPKQIRDLIEGIIGAEGKAGNGVFSITIERKDMTDISLHGLHITPAFEIHGMLVFQSLGGSKIMVNADMALKPGEIDPFISQLIMHDIVFQAEHQHMYDFEPDVWFIHFRAAGDPRSIAMGIKAALNATSAPFPQKPPSDPTTPLPAEEMGEIIGAKPHVQADGVVIYKVPRAEPIILGGVRINPYLNVEAPIAFQPIDGGSRAAAIPDYNMVASEVQKVVGLQRRRGWDIGCLYNQETDEHPQLYFSHQFKVGEPLSLAHEIRDALNLMNVKLE